MAFDRVTTAVVFVVLIALATVAMVVATPMQTRTVLMMVLPSMVVFGLVMLALGVKHGEYRASH